MTKSKNGSKYRNGSKYSNGSKSKCGPKSSNGSKFRIGTKILKIDRTPKKNRFLTYTFDLFTLAILHNVRKFAFDIDPSIVQLVISIFDVSYLNISIIFEGRTRVSLIITVRRVQLDNLNFRAKIIF